MNTRHPSFLLTWLLIGFAAGDVGAVPNRKIPLEYKVKAAFLYRTLKFIDWTMPAELPSDNTMTL
ncbi:MAG: hypothetical protein JRJ60_23000, partial [Deltaproteobacteria bacterium]|nr:hypothetical protein [Deltaproteobacteria bacterium]